MNEPGTAKASFREWMGVIGALIGAFMAILDINIANANLRDIQGSLGASLDESSWISTAYLIGEIVIIPLTAWLSDIFSLRRYFLFNGVLFVIFSVLCGAAKSLPMMIVCRFFQGMTGGVLIPLASSTIVLTLPPAQRAFGLMLFSLAVSLAPGIGPSIGGWVTIHFGWEYSFYLNLLPGIGLLAMTYYGLQAKPMKLRALLHGDWWGVVTMAVGLATLTYVLEEGNRKDWLDDPSIAKCSLICAVCLTLFLIIELTTSRPFINLRLLKARNFVFANVAAFAFGLAMFGGIHLLPLYLAQIQDYDALQIGQSMIWTGLPQLLILPFMPYLLKRLGARALITFGFGMFALSSYLNSFMSHDTAYDQLVLTQIIRAYGPPFVIMPLTTLAYLGIPPAQIGSASAIFIMIRTLGGSVGISFLGTFLTHRYQFHFARFAEKLSVGDPFSAYQVDLWSTYFSDHGTDLTLAQQNATLFIGKIMNREAYVMAYADTYLFMSVTVALVALLAVLFLRKSNASTPVPQSNH